MKNKEIWLNVPPKEWMEGFPIGNGRLAAMVWGNESCDILSLNHEWLWSAKFRDKMGFKRSHSALESVRELLLSGDYFAATGAANAFFSVGGGTSGQPVERDSYLPVGDLCFELNNVKSFTKRVLDIEKSLALIHRKTESSAVDSVFFAHYTLGNIVARWAGEISGKLSFKRESGSDETEETKYCEQGIEYHCDLGYGLEFVVTVNLKTDAKLSVNEDGILVSGGSYLTAYINIATNVKDLKSELSSYNIPDSMAWDEILSLHTKESAEYMNKVEFVLSETDSDTDKNPIDKRLELIRQGKNDIALEELYFHFGRYLLLSSSRNAELPANLQGKWNNIPSPPWGSDYHLDINLQMNYWFAEQLNMSDCVEPLFRFAESMVADGKRVANEIYNCDGVVFPLCTDGWGKSTPRAYGWAVWIGAAAWIAQYFWNHYRYTGDSEFLKNRAYPFFKEVARFYESYLIKDKNGVFQILPSQSPENRFAGTGNFPVSICISAAMDVQLAYDALNYAVKASEILQCDDADKENWLHIIKNLPEFSIGKDGRLLEWNEEKCEVEPEHRHFSHLYGLYPSDIFNPAERPQQYNACAKSLDYRIEKGSSSTGWSCAWAAGCYARLGEGKKVHDCIKKMFVEFSTDSLLCLHPPHIYQIDGNFGTTAVITEALVQCWGGKVHLLRTLPDEWQSGCLKGVRLSGGHTLGMEWKNGKITHLDIMMGFAESLTLTLPDMDDINICNDAGKHYTYNF